MSTYEWETIAAVRRDRIDEGERSIARIDSHARETFYDWLRVGEALDDMQHAAMELAGANQAAGKAYNAAHAVIAKRAPKLAALDKGVRSKAIWMAANREAVEAWHAALGDAKKRLVNHPATVKRQFENETGVTAANKARQNLDGGTPRRSGQAAQIDAATRRPHDTFDRVEQHLGLDLAGLFDLSSEHVESAADNLLDIFGEDAVKRLLATLQKRFAPAPTSVPIDPAFAATLTQPKRGRGIGRKTAMPR
jgi:hypothetical protein